MCDERFKIRKPRPCARGRKRFIVRPSSTSASTTQSSEASRIAGFFAFAPQAAGQDVFTLLNSAVANAKAKNPAIRDASELWVVEALVDEGRTMKRFRPRAQGRGFRILKRSSHISVAVSDVKTSSKSMNLKKTIEKGATK